MGMLYRELFDEVCAPDRLKKEVWKMTKEERKPRKRVQWLLAAAALAAVLMGVAGADSGGLREPLREDLPVIGPVTLEEELGRKWAESGGVLDEEQKAVIARAVQDVRVSDTRDGITVAIDSVYATEFYLEMLLNIQGEDLAGSNGCYLETYELSGSVSSAPDRGICHIYTGSSDLGVTADGTVVRGLCLGISSEEGLSLLDGAELELRLGNLKTYRDGEWVLPISLAPAADREVFSLEKAAAMGYPSADDRSRQENEAEPITLRDIRVTSTGFRFRTDWGCPETGVYLCLSNGMEIKHGDASESGKVDGSHKVEGRWPAPADFSKIEALRVGDTVIPLRPQTS